MALPQAMPSPLKLQPCFFKPGTHSFILLGGAKSLLLDPSHVEHVSVRQRLFDALKLLLEGKAESWGMQ